MSGEHDLETLLTNMTATLAPDVYVFATLLPGSMIPDGIETLMRFHEAEGITLILTREAAIAHNIDHSFACRMISLDVHSALEAVGFIAAISAALAAKGMGVNPVAGYFHDHLFVPENRADDAMAVL
ncbi:MAG: ribonuclease H family protein, partial [SAR116 cluster bacterium]|nr:ribonuclease H family protein [SAR116 cluster bacterium]